MKPIQISATPDHINISFTNSTSVFLLFSVLGMKPTIMKNVFLFIALFGLSIITSSYSSKKSPPLKKNALVFPVAAKKATVGSFWGVPREGGRKHKGVDIFARKGTPVVAVSDGVVTSVGNGGKGGKVVWVKSSDHPWTAYYAHLDKQKVYQGQFVKKGQIIGTVGNTGNARYTPSHLHFGIYNNNGAVNPLPYIKKSPKITLSTSSRKVISKKSTGNNTVTKKPARKHYRKT
jgi:murein DD-endopeptidase MepM/ murein hydrolase activator NlpD